MKLNMIKIGLLVAIVSFSGCSSKHNVTLNKSFIPQKNSKVLVGNIENKTNAQCEFDIKDMLRVAFEAKLVEYDLLVAEGNQTNLTLDIDILEYSEGNAFKRWIMPGWGATILTIEAKLLHENIVVGNVKATSNIGAGGGFTIGAWKYIYDDIANDVIEDFREAYKKQEQEQENLTTIQGNQENNI